MRSRPNTELQTLKEPAWFVPIFLIVLGLFVSPATAAVTPMKKVSLMPLWSSQAQFAGYYVALDKGIYSRYGIDMKILKGGPGHPAAEALQSGEADFAVLWLSAALRQYAAGTRVVNLAQHIQRSSLMLIAKKSSGIRTPADVQGRKVGLWSGDLALPAQAFLDKYHLQVRKMAQTYTVNLFLQGGLDVASAMWYNEYHTILNAGVNPDELTIFTLSDHGITFPEDGLYTLEKTYHRDPALAGAVAAASLEGWRYAFEHPDEALDIVIRHMKQEHLPANRSHQKWMLERMRDLFQPRREGGKMGQLTPADYEAVGTALRRGGVIRSFPGFEEFVVRDHAHN